MCVSIRRGVNALSSYGASSFMSSQFSGELLILYEILITPQKNVYVYVYVYVLVHLRKAACFSLEFQLRNNFWPTVPKAESIYFIKWVHHPGANSCVRQKRSRAETQRGSSVLCVRTGALSWWALTPWGGGIDRSSWKSGRLLVKGRPFDWYHFRPDPSRWSMALS